MNSDDLIGQVIDGKYRIESQLGKGGMGAVYLATHLGTERPVAVKVIVQQYMERAEFVERFRREARAAGRLRHPNVVNVTDFGIADMADRKTAYLVMEYLDGCTLGEILEEEQQLPLSWSLDIIHQVCSAIHEAHAQGIIHRDLKPDNIWLEPNQRGGYTVKVLDFGIAKLEEHQAERPEGDVHVTFSGLPTERIVRSSTIADGSETIAAAGGTLISEPQTLIVRPEAGTLIRDAEDEKGTAIMTPSPAPAEDVATPFDTKGTKLIEADSGDRTEAVEGAAAEASATVKLTRVGAVLGTPLYMSPEQCRGEKLSPQSDIYSLGVITFQMLSGRTPFEGDFTSVMSAHQEIEAPRLGGRKIPRRVRKVVHAALSKTPDERPQDAQAFSARLQAGSDGIGALLIRAMTIYVERLPTFLAIGFLISIPVLLLSLTRAGSRFAAGAELIQDSVWTTVFLGFLELAMFLAQVFSSALLIGLITWVISQILAVPLRPIRLRTAFSKVRERLRPLLKTVTLSTFIVLFGWIAAAIPGGIAGGIVAGLLYLIFGSTAAAIGGGVTVAVLGWLFSGVGISSLFMLVAPVVMMEGITGRASFRRSSQLVRRSYGTVFAAAFITYLAPVLLGAIIGVTITGLVKQVDNKNAIQRAVDNAVKEQQQKVETKSTPTESKESDLNIKLTGPGVQTGEREPGETDEEFKAKMLRRSIATGVFDLFWAPITVFLTTFISIITALIYLKTRQAGGESIQDLLEQFEDSEQPKSKWQRRVQDRLIQSGRITSKP